MNNKLSHQQKPGVPLPKPAITLRGIIIAAFLWLLYTIIETIIVYQQTTNTPVLALFVGMMMSSAMMALLSLPAWWLLIREMDETGWWRRLAAHAAAAPVYAFTWFASYSGMFRLLFGETVFQQAQIMQNRLWMIWGAFWAYLLQFAIFHVLRSLQRLRERESQAAELQELAREGQIAALKAQINPHFLFNTLNTISAMVTGDPELARTMIAQLAELLRYALDSTAHREVALQDEVRFIENYLDLEGKRFSDRLKVQLHVDPRALEVKLPPMILQPLVENAVQHGIAPREEGGQVSLRITCERDRLHVSIADTGLGLNGTPREALFKHGIGLRNTDERLRRLYGPSAGLRFVENKSGTDGFEVRFELPLQQPASAGRASE